MKYIFFWITILLVFSCHQQKKEPVNLPQWTPSPVIFFPHSIHDFGIIKAGEKVKHHFPFINIGTDTLIILQCRGSGGGLVPSWPRKPFSPGSVGFIELYYDTKNVKGQRNKRATVEANTHPRQSFLFMRGKVIPNESPK